MTSALRGDVLAFPAPKGATGREQKGRRFAIVLQPNEFQWLQTVVVAPTSTSAQPALFRPPVIVQGRRTLVLLDQLSTIDRSRIGANIGHLAPHDLAELESSLRTFLGLF